MKKAKKRAAIRDRLYQLTKKRLVDKFPQDSTEPIRIITSFGSQWDSVRSVLDKHWGILTNTPALASIVGDSPKLVARGARSIGDMLIKSEFVREPDTTWLSNYAQTLGMFPCNKCQICPYVDRTSTFTDAHGQGSYEIRNLINCSSTRVIYVITCPCPKIYVGKTKWSLKIRIGEHLREINDKEKLPDKPLAKHFAQCHDRSSRGLTVKGIYALKLPNRRGDFDRILLPKEKWSVYRLKSLVPFGLNTELNLQVFLDPWIGPVAIPIPGHLTKFPDKLNVLFHISWSYIWQWLSFPLHISIYLVVFSPTFPLITIICYF